MTQRVSPPWLFSRRADLFAFAGSTIMAWGLVLAGALAGVLHRGMAPALWLAIVVGVDVAHVWTTLFRVHFDRAPDPWSGRLRYALPLACWSVGVALHGVSAALFWRALAYLAVAHFVRQQAGWVALYHRRATATALDVALDRAAVYTGTLFPIVYWHAHLPRAFAWFLAGDFAPGLPRSLSDALHPLALALLVVWAARQVACTRSRTFNPGTALVVGTTWANWYGGIVLLDSDYAFTVTNVLAHGVPYYVLLWHYAHARHARDGLTRIGSAVVARGVAGFVAFVVVIALCEEFGWDRLVWHDHASVFGDGGWRMRDAWLVWLVPLLAVPQAMHYVLDGIVWRRRAGTVPLARQIGW